MSIATMDEVWMLMDGALVPLAKFCKNKQKWSQRRGFSQIHHDPFGMVSMNYIAQPHLLVLRVEPGELSYTTYNLCHFQMKSGRAKRRKLQKLNEMAKAVADELQDAGESMAKGRFRKTRNGSHHL